MPWVTFSAGTWSKLASRQTLMRVPLTILTALLLCITSAPALEPKAPGTRDTTVPDQGDIQYTHKETTDPIPNRIHILKVNLASNAVRPMVVHGPDPDGEGPAEVSLTDPRKLASSPSVLAFVNSNPWDSFPDANGKRNRNWYSGQPVDIHGMSGTGGNMRSQEAANNTSVWFDIKERVHFGHRKGDAPMEATSGFQQILAKGKPLVPKGGPRHPRTAIGADRTGATLWLVVVDGRQRGYSEGMNLQELAAVMQDLGCWSATNMDGGGSSIMGLRDKTGKMQVLNRPSGRFLGAVKIRPLPTLLTITQSKSQKN